jgi:hypothetical protein
MAGVLGHEHLRIVAVLTDGFRRYPRAGFGLARALPA